MSQIRYLTNKRAELCQSENHWSFPETSHRVNLDHWFEITQEEWKHQLADVLLGLQAFDNMQDCCLTVEKAFVLLLGLHNMGLRSRNKSIKEKMTDLDLKAIFSKGHHVKEITNHYEAQELVDFLDLLAKTLIATVHDLKTEVCRLSTDSFENNESMKEQLEKSVPMDQEKWIDDMVLAKDALEETLKWKEYKQKLDMPASFKTERTPPCPKFNDKLAETYLRERLSLLMGFVNPTHQLPEGPMTPDQLEVMARDMLFFEGQEEKGYWKSPQEKEDRPYIPQARNTRGGGKKRKQESHRRRFEKFVE